MGGALCRVNIDGIKQPAILTIDGPMSARVDREVTKWTIRRSKKSNSECSCHLR